MGRGPSQAGEKRGAQHTAAHRPLCLLLALLGASPGQAMGVCEVCTHRCWSLRKGHGWQTDVEWERLAPLTPCPLPPSRLGRSGAPGPFLALPLTPGVTLGQTLNPDSGAHLLLRPKERKGLAHHCWGLKGTRSRDERGRDLREPHPALHHGPPRPSAHPASAIRDPSVPAEAAASALT